MNAIKTIVAISMLTLCALVASQGAERSFRVTLRVVNDEGEPVSGAEAGVTYENMAAMNGPEHFVSPKGPSDEHGCVTLSGEMFLHRLAYGAKKEGYYQTTGLDYRFSEESDRRWVPWNPTIEVVLKRIKNPMPMYARKVIEDVPAKAAIVGYDMETGDWVAPYGRGKVADIEFFGVGEAKDGDNFRGELMINFPGDGNGIQAYDRTTSDGSALRMPYSAPEGDYVAKWKWRSVLWFDASGRNVIERVDEANPNRDFFFRVRSVVNAGGKVVQAWYGKIHGPFNYGHNYRTDRPAISFTYYLNPDGTRNVEFDPKRNLFQPAKPDDSAFWNLGP